MRSNSKDLPLSILNYFAAFTETKFNFKTLVNYCWTDDEFSLDLGLFQEFQEQLLEKIKAGDKAPVAIKPHEHTLSLLKEDLLFDIENALSGKFGPDYLKTCVEQALAAIVEADKVLIASDQENQVTAKDDQPDPERLQQQKKKAFREGARKYNLAFRKQLELILIDHQDRKVDRLKAELGLAGIPASIFNSTHFLKQQFDALQLLARVSHSETDYFESVKAHFKNNLTDIVLYDLFINIQKYARFNSVGTQYLFFHELNRATDNNNLEAYPVFFIEVDFVLGTDEVLISFPRDLIFINTPAVNYFRFPSILTTPRSTTFQHATADISGIETFLQAQYGISEPFALESHFKRISALKENFPDIKCRLGFQVVRKENKRLLDYSELMTRLLSGSEGKFSDFISQYIDGHIENTQDQVDRQYKEQCPIKSPRRYISDIPLHLNDAQKRILLSLANAKNKVVVVDGPPGTGKSHTIAALVYWANQEKKSVVITSHKKEALDVIDRMLTDKFKTLHPTAKPSIVRFGKNGHSINTLENTFQNSVINAAGNRANEYNAAAAEKDARAGTNRIVEKLKKQLATSGKYAQSIGDLNTFEQLQEELLASSVLDTTIADLPKVPSTITIDFDGLMRFSAHPQLGGLKQMSIPELDFLIKHRSDIPLFLDACEAINLNGSVADIDIHTTAIPETFIKVLEAGLAVFKKTVPVHSLTVNDLSGNFFKRLLNKPPDEKEREKMINALKTLQYVDILQDISRLKEIAAESVTLEDLASGLEDLRTALSLRQHKDIIREYRSIGNHQEKPVSDIFKSLNGVTPVLEDISTDLIDSISNLFVAYGPILSMLNIDKENLYSLSRLHALTGSETKLWQWVCLHYRLSKTSAVNTVCKNDFDAYYEQQQKAVEHANDLRLKNLNNHLNEIAKIKVSFEGGKRFTVDQAGVLLKNVSGLIAEPDMIARFFPMEENLIDLLIIDEASQVSIANSISLILRARQVVVFGDEYQYGAVSAVNVSAKYSASYFREIIQAYTSDYQVAASEQETATLVDTVSREITEEDLEAEPVTRPQDNAGSILWLKTFNIRTSTLSFAKAIANYTTSLRDHYRSFTEIIDYSNTFFYKPAQLELTVNRIRTRPINQVLAFIPVETRGDSGRNVNLDEIDAIIDDIAKRISNGFKGTIGIITSFKEQQARMEQSINEKMNLPELKRNHNLAVWFVGDVQGEERDVIYYSFVEDKKYGNADLRSIYPVIDGTADTIRSLKMQRLNVGFSRAKDTMVFVHSMPVGDYSHSRLGDALKHYQGLLENTAQNDFFVEDPPVFESPAEERLYQLLVNTRFVESHRETLKIVPQFNIGEYIRAQYRKQIPRYRVDFLLTLACQGREQALILEYDGVEYHTKNPDMVTEHNFSAEYLDYDISRQIELESYGYRFLRINKFTLRPEQPGQTESDVLDRLLTQAFAAQ
jgi:very-short-patch-repair endonuclease